MPTPHLLSRHLSSPRVHHEKTDFPGSKSSVIAGAPESLGQPENNNTHNDLIQVFEGFEVLGILQTDPTETSIQPD